MSAELVPALERQTPVGSDVSAMSQASVQRSALFRPVDSAFLAGFRFVYGITMLARAWYFVAPSESGVWFEKTHEYYLDPDFHFSYFGFEWVRLLPANAMYAFFVGMMCVSMCVTLGLFYRVASVLLCIGYVYAFLLDKALFLNHYYLLSLISFLMCLVPANCVLSIDGLINPKVRSDVVPAWTLWLLRGQLAIPYFFGGIAKLNSDWLHGEPIRKWLHTGFMGLGRPWLHNEWAVAFVAYGGVLFDLCVVPLLLWRRTRVLAFIGVLVFNLCNSQLFRIGVFPWFMLFGSMLFFPAAWHRRVLATVFPISPGPAAGSNRDNETSPLMQKLCTPFRRGATVTFLAVYFSIQVLWPLRHHLDGGQPYWTGKGDLFAWRMMLYDKTGELKFFRAYPSAETGSARKERIEIPWNVIENSLNGYQQLMLPRDPDLVLQLAHYLSHRYRAADGTPAEIYVQSKISYNTRKPQRLVDPEVNLAAVERTAFGPTPWIRPFENAPRRRLDQAIHDLPKLPASPTTKEGSEEVDPPRYSAPGWE